MEAIHKVSSNSWTKWGLVVCILALVEISSISGRKLPSYIQSCKRTENINECAMKMVAAARPHLAKGIPKIKVPAMEPLIINELQVNRNNDNLQLKLKLKNVTVYGPSHFIINKININLPKLTMDLSITLPYLDINTEYDVDGRILVVPLKGTGIFKGNITNTKIEMSGSGKIIDDLKQKKYSFAQVTDAKIKVRVGDTSKISVVATDSNPNARQLVETATNFYRQNSKQVLELIIIEEDTGLEVALEN
uniref:Circadian clock-controlled protein n=1 Tax=Cacopsylla melanoneura TaxID=428564 RepID=A0A8D8XRF2_9HEMI